jgi:imidazolonepropionase-like amidohydrolase
LSRVTPLSTSTLFRLARVFDGASAGLSDPQDVLVAEGEIKEISRRSLRPGNAEVVDCRGRVLMPGLIDAHVHVYASSVDPADAVVRPASFLAHFAARFLKASLDRGFTTVRDAGGADVGLARAIDAGLLPAPRLFYGGRAISQTGGHGDMRPGDRSLCDADHGCACINALVNIADGADAIRKAVREELRRGASHIKLMGSGGVTSPTDPLDGAQYSDGEILAAVDEADRGGAYVAAHCHPAAAARRAAALGVRSIEHGTMIDREAATFIAGRGVFVVPTLAAIFGLQEEGEALGLPPVSRAKLRRVADRALESLDVMRAAGVKMGLGTDLLGQLYTRQTSELTLRARVLSSFEILHSACEVNAQLLRQEGRLGCIREGALADLLVVDGNPLEDIGLLDGAGERLAVVMSRGRFHKRTI